MSEKSTDQANVTSNHQTASPKQRKTMKECLEVAAQIRQELEGRKHSNSTELVAEDRQR